MYVISGSIICLGLMGSLQSHHHPGWKVLQLLNIEQEPGDRLRPGIGLGTLNFLSCMGLTVK